MPTGRGQSLREGSARSLHTLGHLQTPLTTDRCVPPHQFATSALLLHKQEQKCQFSYKRSASAAAE